MWDIQKIVSKGDYNYAVVPEHPNSTKNGYVLEHRVVVENDLGRILREDEIIHHKNENKKDNRLENLEITSVGEHNIIHNKTGRLYTNLVCHWCGYSFVIEKRKTHLIKKNKLNCTCCSPKCRGSLSREIQLNGISCKVQIAIDNNVINEFVINGPVTQLDRVGTF